MHRRVRLALLAFVLLAPAVPAAAVELAFETTEPGAVVVTGVTPGGSLAVYALVREWTGFSTRVRETAEVVADDDGDGTVRLELDRAVAPMSAWVAVDLASGALAVSGPPGFTPRELPFPTAALTRGPADRLDRLELTGRMVHVLLVRPGDGPGAWLLHLGDGGAQDDDGANDGTMGFLLARMTPLGASPPPPDEVAAGDVVALVDPDTLDFSVVTLVGQGGR